MRGQSKSLTPRQRVKVNAALSLIHGQGHNAQAVSDQARNFMSQGLDARGAYERAINAHLQQHPQLFGTVSKVLRLVEASDDPTVTAYDKALTEYIKTGSEDALAPIMPTLAHDSVRLAMMHGELQDGAVTAEAVQAASGLPLAPSVIAHKAAFQQPLQPESGLAIRAPAPPRDYGSQAGTGYGSTGYVARGSRERWAEAARNDLNTRHFDPRASMSRQQVAAQMKAGSGVVSAES